ncbi:MAG: WG repeat-containing protein [Solobacterium sp.]|nr:WG repeat-containing protein [Solobacterium sp.]
MKQIIITAVAAFMLAGCGRQAQPLSAALSIPESGTAAKTAPEVIETTEEPADPTLAVWVHEPDLELEATDELDSFHYVQDNSYGIYLYEDKGYPQNWVKDSPIEYTEDAIAVKKNGKYGVYDYAGNERYPAELEPYEDTYLRTDNPVQYLNYGGFIIQNQYGQVFDSEFRTTSKDTIGGLGGDFQILSIKNGKFVKSFYGEITPFAFSGIGQRIIAPDLNEKNETAGYRIVDENGKILGPVLGNPESFVNGFITTDKGLPTYFGMNGTLNRNRLQIINADTGKEINNEIYSGVKFFENGYCPVKKGDKWGFINEQGEAVSEFIFDDASALYEGKTYVSHNGEYGILDLPATLQKTEKITGMNCYGEEISQPADPIKDTVTVKVNNLNIRSGPGTSYDKTDVCREGMNLEVFETKEADGYTWYRIDETNWIADKNGEWLEGPIG